MLIDENLAQNPLWWQAVPLSERLLLLRSAEKTAGTEAPIDDALARKRLQEWRSTSPFDEDAYFRQRLSLAGITYEEFVQILGESPKVVLSRSTSLPDWLQTLVAAYTLPFSPDLPFPEAALEGYVGREFLTALAPLFQHLQRQLRTQVAEMMAHEGAVPFDPEKVEELVFSQFPQWIENYKMLNRTMVLELRLASRLGLLAGATPEARFESFVQKLHQPAYILALWQRYPVLIRQLITYLTNWVNARVEFFERFGRDWPLIRERFSPQSDPGVLVELKTDLGDPHRGGRTVFRLRFESGLELIYKPKPLATDLHFQQLLSWLNERGVQPPLRPVQILNCGDYGWVEFIYHQECTSEEAVERFYKRQGIYLALLYALEATDFHFQNVLAAGEHPILTDLESLFQPKLAKVWQPDKHVGSKELNHSVLEVGLLPRRGWQSEDSPGIDYSGMGADAGQEMPRPIHEWAKVGTDEMHLAQRNGMIKTSGRNRPLLNGQRVQLLDYLDQILDGFSQMYNFLIEHREQLLAEDGPLMAFAEDAIRVFLRGTSLYKIFQQDSLQPALLTDALKRERFLDRLWIGIQYQPDMARVIAAEQHDLEACDFPIFITQPASRDLWSSTYQRIPDFFQESGFSLVQRRLQTMGPADQALQLWIIKASVIAQTIGLPQSVEPSYTLATAAKEVDAAEVAASETDAAELIARAAAVGERLSELAIRESGAVSWLGLDTVQRQYWYLNRTRSSLYDGLSGIALFLGYLGDVAGGDYTLLARQTLETLLSRLDGMNSPLTAVGGFEGWGGIIYALTHLGTLWGDAALLERAERTTLILPELIEQDRQLDVVGGTAGCLLSLLSLAACLDSDSALEAAVLCGNHLLEQAQVMEQGIGWVVPGAGPRPLSGFSHGTAGIAYALLKLSAVTGEEKFRTAALEGLAYERTLFSPEMKNWVDLRPDPEAGHNGRAESRYQVAWCHGAPGIGLSRLSMLPYLDSPELRSEIEAAFQTTLARGFGKNHSLCHGDLGNLEFLLLGSQVLDDAVWAAQLRDITAAVAASIERDGRLCGVPLALETPGLMTGLAGIGYGLLRLALPDRIPSILLLEPPALVKINKTKETGELQHEDLQ